MIGLVEVRRTSNHIFLISGTHGCTLPACATAWGQVTSFPFNPCLHLAKSNDLFAVALRSRKTTRWLAKKWQPQSMVPVLVQRLEKPLEMIRCGANHCQGFVPHF
jgi:hypothetical protein